jgi:DNA-binding CsgD family transcriptional regulator
MYSAVWHSHCTNKNDDSQCTCRAPKQSNIMSMNDLSLIRDLVDQREGSGFVMLSANLHTLHWDRRAWELCQKIADQPNGHAPTALPESVIELGREILKLLDVRNDVKDWEQFQVRRVVKNGAETVLLTGIGLPDHHRQEDSRLLIILERIGRRQEFTLDDAKTRFGLTERETVVIEHLLKGWTNKEIANAIAISEQTVKEHIKHIMDKTKTSTRTGILVAVLQGEVSTVSG